MIEYYVRLLTESARLETMDRALRAVVRPGDVVADLGTGTGAFALFAARAGARRVYAIESGDIAAVARELAVANGAADVVTVVQADAGVWSPPEPVDVVVFEDLDDVGIGPVVGTLLPRWRGFLRPGGCFVPSTLTTWAAPAESAAAHAKLGTWPQDRAFGLDLGPLMQRAREMRSNDWVDRAGLLAPGREVFRHEIGRALPAQARAETRFTVTRAGTFHGIAVWFDQLLAPGITWSNAPAPRPTAWGHAFLHTPDATVVREGDELRLSLSYAPWGRGAQTWSWTVEVVSRDGTLCHREERSTFRGLPMSAAQLRRRSLDHALRPGPEAERTRAALALFDGHRTTREIAAEVARLYPGLLPEGEDGARRMLELLLPLAEPVVSEDGW